MRVVHVVALMAVVTCVTPVSAQAPRAATPDAAKPAVDGPLTLQGPSGRPGGGRGAGPRAGASGARPTVTAVRAAQAPTIDGRLDDAIWRTAALINKFVQAEPVEGAEPADRMEVRFVYDDTALWIGARMDSAHGGGIQAPMSRRDDGR